MVAGFYLWSRLKTDFVMETKRGWETVHRWNAALENMGVEVGGVEGKKIHLASTLTTQKKKKIAIFP